MKLLFVVLARDASGVQAKIAELTQLRVPYLVVCGQPTNLPHVVFRKPLGKYDAINFSFQHIPPDVDVVVFNDVDTRIAQYRKALPHLDDGRTAMVFAKVRVRDGPQFMFYKLLDSIRRRIPITASGEMIFIRYDVLKTILPLKPCKAEDSYMLLKVLSLGRGVVFCERSCVVTERTKTIENEEVYKRKTVAGLYQALSYTNPPKLIAAFYVLLPFASPLLLLMGRRGYYWAKGILLGFLDYLRGDRSGRWDTAYLG